LVIGAVAGLLGAAAMTAFMNRRHSQLPPAERYPAPPREIVGKVLAAAGVEEGRCLADASLAAHGLYGAAGGLVLAAIDEEPSLAKGSTFGLLVWAASYLGWIPALSILAPATRHPPRRNAMMIESHLVWGAITAMILKEVLAARKGLLSAGPLKDG